MRTILILIASAEQNAKPTEYKNLAEKKLAFLGRFSYGTYSTFCNTHSTSSDHDTVLAANQKGSKLLTKPQQPNSSAL